MRSILLPILIVVCLNEAGYAQRPVATFSWPEGIRAAVSLTFDDARLSQVDIGMPLLDRSGIRATFFVSPGNLDGREEAWKTVVENGHEIGNHSLYHPCTGNFLWARDKALEDYTLEKMRVELKEAGHFIYDRLGILPETFAYPCGQTYVGRGPDTRSYVPLVAELFLAGRGWLDEGPNDPGFCDLSQLMGMEMDGLDFDQMLPVLESVKEAGMWIVFAGHEIGTSGVQTTRVDMLEKLIQYVNNPANHMWIAPVGTIARYVLEQRNPDLRISNDD